MERQSNALGREQNFHDCWAREIDLESVDVEAHFEGSTAPENRFILRHLGDVTGLHLLDIGCGAGENSAFFASRGAHCVAADVSPGMVRVALNLAKRRGSKIEGRVIDAAELPFADETFDVVYAANVLHHVDSEKTLREIHRVLKPGGRACAWDPLKYNPVINVYRRMAAGVRTEDEHPLDFRLIKSLHRQFGDVQWDTFWIATLWIFLRFYLIERVDPNEERYWKKIITEEERLRSTYQRLEAMDRVLKRLPLVNRLAWNLAFVATK